MKLHRLELRDRILKIYRLMHESYGTQTWWPGDTPLEICIGAILTQNTNWQNASKAVKNLIANNALNINRLDEIELTELAEMIRSSGYYNQKAKKLKAFARYVIENGNSLEAFAKFDTQTLRKKLLSIKGIGPETADDMLLYAFDRVVFVVDTYTARIAIRHGLINPETDYEQLQYLFQKARAF